MIITFNDEGILMPDSKAYETMEKLCKEGEDFAISSMVAVYALQLLIVERKLPYESIELHFEDEKIRFNEFGILSTTPKELNSSLELLVNLVKAQSKKRRECI
ncbi:hypothetical protein [Rossellomorea marisflavi]|uniref:hypothetical protein n=1 Tax=Rossellomorea marisflavi TaxID=189381 RepID=UPI003FA1812E